MRKKKILLISDDLRFPSGVGTMSKELVAGSSKDFDWIQMGGSIQHPDFGKIQDVSTAIKQEYNIESDVSVKIYPVNGYGTPELLRRIISIEQPDAIMLFTDPRFFLWVFDMEHELRKTLPIIYLNIWDDLPYPRWNKPFYESCDLLLCISKQTKNIVENCTDPDILPRTNIHYLPHGINENRFYPIERTDENVKLLNTLRYKLFGENNYNFVVFWNNRNIRRKLPGDLILAFKHFCSKLPKSKADKCVLVMHSAAVDENGTDLHAVKNNIAPECNIVIDDSVVLPSDLNLYYNISDITINIASNEGWGLSSTESLMSGTPIINAVTGGLQDQLRFEDTKGKWIEFTTDFPTNHTGRYKKCGKWGIPVFPSNRSLQGSPMTPFIFDDRVSYEDVSDAILKFYMLDTFEKKEMGISGRTWVTSAESGMSANSMCKNFVDVTNQFLINWKPKPTFYLLNTLGTKKVYSENIGILNNE